MLWQERFGVVLGRIGLVVVVMMMTTAGLPVVVVAAEAVTAPAVSPE